jgi:hypothetical protein
VLVSQDIGETVRLLHRAGKTGGIGDRAAEQRVAGQPDLLRELPVRAIIEVKPPMARRAMPG